MLLALLLHDVGKTALYVLLKQNNIGTNY